MKRTIKLIPVIVLLLQIFPSFAQDPHFSQYRVNPTFVNPANSGLNCDLRATAGYRDQWKSVGTPFRTAVFSFDMNTSRSSKGRGSIGVGVQFLNDRAGDARITMTQGMVNVSGILKLSEDSKLSMGLMGGFGQRSADYNGLRWDQQYTNGSFNQTALSGETFSTPTHTYADAGAGIAWSYGKDQGYITQNNGLKMNIGLAAYHFGLPQTSFFGSEEKLNTKFIAYASAEMGKQNSNLAIIPEFYFVGQGSQREILFGSVFRYLLQEGSQFTGFLKSSAISLGANYRWKDAVIPSLMIEYGTFAVGFSYDITVSSLSTSNRARGGFECMLTFKTPNPFSKVSRARI